ncbi:MAG TPA: N-acetylmuramic acid 6-phosphate etherase, partial [Gemmataceae bacterium]|nr:N-acetylmuramic acid 6-phosphate etherase [Gemmataceae bacterium]
AEDALVAAAMATQADAIAHAIDLIAERLRQGGRLIYAGAGTSGRLGVLDATECPPTFNSPPGQVAGIIAGGREALTRAVEGAEDHPEFAERDLAALHVGAGDVVAGIATSGRTPYVLGAVAYARRQGIFTIGISCNRESELAPVVDLAITPIVGPEIVSGSTRLKAGTATKLVLNMLTTGAMVRLGKTFGDLMVDLRVTNNKLRIRCNRIVRQVMGLATEAADELLQRCGGEVKTALVAHLAAVEPEEARRRLSAADGRVRAALGLTSSRLRVSTLERANPQAGSPLYLGIDGGGTQTVALLTDADGTVLGRGEAGPSNLHAVGVGPALRALETAAAAAFATAKLPVQPVTAACLGLAGADRPWERSLLHDWAQRVHLCEHLELTSDGALLLAAGTPDNWGLALVAGTGSIAVGRAADGRTARAGGWGYLLGDEGSGYRIALAALQAIAQATDGRGPPTALVGAFLSHLRLDAPQALIATVYRSDFDRSRLASLAPLVFAAAEAGDVVARQIVADAAEQLAEAGAAVVRQLGWQHAVPLALAGGCLLASASYREQVVCQLETMGLTFAPVTPVPEPAVGAVRLARSAKAETAK